MIRGRSLRREAARAIDRDRSPHSGANKARQGHLVTGQGACRSAARKRMAETARERCRCSEENSLPNILRSVLTGAPVAEAPIAPVAEAPVAEAPAAEVPAAAGSPGGFSVGEKVVYHARNGATKEATTKKRGRPRRRPPH